MGLRSVHIIGLTSNPAITYEYFNKYLCSKALFKRNDAILIFIGIVISAYMTISYNGIYEYMTNPEADIGAVAFAGLASLGVGAVLFYLFVRGKIK